MKMQRMSRYQAEDQDYALRKVKSELMIKVRECEVLACELEATKDANSKEIDSLRQAVSSLTSGSEDLKLENGKLQLEVQRVKDEAESDQKIAVREADRKAREELSKVQREAQAEAEREKAALEKAIADMKERFGEEKGEWEARQNALVAKLQETNNNEISELRSKMMNEFTYELQKLEEEATERCRNERDKAERFIKESLAGLEMAAEAEQEVLRQEIKSLQVSLANRKKFIDELASTELNTESKVTGLEELIEIRKRLKDNVEQLMRENELLKVKTAEKYEKDLREMVRIYENKIEILTAELRNYVSQNDRVRGMYEEEIERKITTKRAHEIEVTNLKNLIKKMRVEMRAVEDELNVKLESMRDQNVTLSMTMMKSMVEVKDKANFYEEENRKLRKLYEKHEKEVDQEKKQVQEKVQYFEGRIEHLQKLLDDQKLETKDKEEILRKHFEEKEIMLRSNLEKERQLVDAMLTESEKDRQAVEKEVEEARQKAREAEVELKEAKDDIIALQGRIKDNDQHIERLKLELEMAGV